MLSPLNRTEFSVVLLIGTLLICLVALAGQSRRASENVVTRAFESAEILADFFKLTQEHYTRSISGVSGVEFTLDPESEPDALMYPATLGRKYTQSFNRTHPDTQFRIYSNYPFVTSQDRVLDDFAERALEILTTSDREPIRVVEPLENGRQRIRYAMPIVMQEGCVACHNSTRWELSRQNWQVGDVRGVREVMITLEPTDLHTKAEAYLLLILMLSASVLGVFVVYPSVRREVKNRVRFHELSIKAEKEAQTHLEAAHTDALTQIGNRRFFDSEFGPLVELYAQTGGMLSLLVVDIDHFKNVNDQFGHDAGDHAIKTVAAILRDHTRPVDKVARFGGEEFVILITDLDRSDVLSIAERIRRDVEAHDFSYGGNDLRLRVSIGATRLQKNETAEDLLKRADMLLYSAKDGGRNRVCGHFGATSNRTRTG